jgi:hypothetical protein
MPPTIYRKPQRGFITIFDAGAGVNPPSGGGTDPWTTLDGRLNAPSGTAQVPTILNGYPTASPPNARVRWPTLTGTQPQWEAAAVDYAVGIDRSIYPTNASLKDPAVVTPPTGVTPNTSARTFTVTGNNVTLDGWDFSLEGGWQVIVKADDCTIQNNNFLVGSNLLTPITDLGFAVNNTTIQKNIIDGAGLNNSQNGGLIQLGDGGTLTIVYNQIQNAYYQFMQVGVNSTTNLCLAMIVKYNLMKDAGLGNHLDSSVHGDWIQLFSSNTGTPTIDSIEIAFNTIVAQSAFNSGQGFSIVSASGSTLILLGGDISYNTAIVASSSGALNYAFIVDTTWLNGSLTMTNNYVDPTQTSGGWDYVGQFNGGFHVTDAPTSPGSSVLNFSTTANWPPSTLGAPPSGRTVVDLTTPAAIPNGTTTGSSTGTTLNISNPVASPGVAAGDIISWGDGTFLGSVTKSGNINMTNGATLT